MKPGETIERAMPAQPSLRFLRVTLWLVLALFVTVPAVALFHAFGPKPNVAPDFTLINQDARPFTLSQQRGHPMILFFGYTHCPDECPTALANLAHALRRNSVDRDVRVAFITVDPKRDSAAVMKRYVRLFDPRFIGLTGRPSDVESVESAYHAWSEELPVNHGARDNYTVAHGSTVYFIDRSGRLRGFGDGEDSQDQMVHELRSYFA
jgi:protein SCO1/2